MPLRQWDQTVAESTVGPPKTLSTPSGLFRKTLRERQGNSDFCRTYSNGIPNSKHETDLLWETFSIQCFTGHPLIISKLCSTVLQHKPSISQNPDPKKIRELQPISMIINTSFSIHNAKSSSCFPEHNCLTSLCYSFLWEQSGSKGKGNTIIFTVSIHSSRMELFYQS